MITKEQLKKIAPYATSANIDKYLPHLNSLIEKFKINANKTRLAMFLAQLLHESGSLRYVEEIASGEDYEGRKDLGNIYKGDGIKFKGRGLIQLTGRENYSNFQKWSGVKVVDNPELLELPENAVLSAIWFWERNGLSQLADTGDVKRVTKRVNGGLNGLADREQYYKKGIEVLN